MATKQRSADVEVTCVASAHGTKISPDDVRAFAKASGSLSYAKTLYKRYKVKPAKPPREDAA
jgi:hypothetical protein